MGGSLAPLTVLRSLLQIPKRQEVGLLSLLSFALNVILLRCILHGWRLLHRTVHVRVSVYLQIMSTTRGVMRNQ